MQTPFHDHKPSGSSDPEESGKVAPYDWANFGAADDYLESPFDDSGDISLPDSRGWETTVPVDASFVPSEDGGDFPRCSRGVEYSVSEELQSYLSSQRIDPRFTPIPEEVLLAAHADFCRLKGSVRSAHDKSGSGLSDLEQKVLEKLRREFVEYVRGLAARLDPMLPDQAKLAPRTIFFPAELPALDPEDARMPHHLRHSGRHSESRPLQVVVELPEGSRVAGGKSPEREQLYSLVAVLRNEDGNSVVAFDNHLTVYEGSGVRLGPNGIRLYEDRPVSVIRISKVIPVGRELEFLRSERSSDFATLVLMSPKAFNLELTQLREHGAKVYYDLEHAYTQPYLAKVVRYSMAYHLSKQLGASSGQLKPNKVYIEPESLPVRSLTPLADDSRGRSFLVETEYGEQEYTFKVRVSHDIERKSENGQPHFATFAPTFECEEYSR